MNTTSTIDRIAGAPRAPAKSGAGRSDLGIWGV